MTSYAYLRVSTDKQTTDNQRQMFNSCDFVIDEYVNEQATSGTIPATQRPQFALLLKKLKKGDTFLVTMLDRLGRNTLDVLTTVQMFQKLGVRLRVLQLDSIDLTSPMGKLMLTMLVGMAELERNLIVERTNAGLARTKAEGTICGTPMRVLPEVLKAMMADKYGDFKMSNKALGEKYGLHINTVFNLMKMWYGNYDGYEAAYNKQRAQHAAKKQPENSLIK
jgi:DNA invertase Pin-like site-specific DNA recombinase